MTTDTNKRPRGRPPIDTPRNIVNVSTGERSFSDADADILAARIDEIFAVVKDPCSIALKVSRGPA